MVTSARRALGVAILASVFAMPAAAMPYEAETIQAADRFGLDPFALSALLREASDYENLRGEPAGVAAFTQVATREVRRLSGLLQYQTYYQDEAALRGRLRGFDLVSARDPALAIEALALTIYHLADSNEGDLAAAAAAYRSGNRAGTTVGRRGLDEARDAGLIDRATYDFVRGILDGAKELRAERDASIPSEGLGAPPSIGAPGGSAGAGLASAPRRGSTGGSASGGGTPAAAPAPAPAARGETVVAERAPSGAPVSDEVRRLLSTQATPNRTRGVTQQYDPRLYDSVIERAAARHGLDPNLLRAVIQTESRFDPGARSATGAAGLGQFTGIAREEVQNLTSGRYASAYADEPALLAELRAFNRDRAFVPTTNIEATAVLLDSYLDHYDGNVEAALTAYNAGYRSADAVRRYGHAGARRRGLLNFSQASTYAPEVLENKEMFDAGRIPAREAGPVYDPGPGMAGALRGIGR